MPYKTVILNVETYGRISRAKKILSEKTNRKLSFGDLFNEVFGKSIEFLDIDADLKSYIRHFSERLGEKPYVKGVLLFGSVARGGFNQYSDIDILVVVSNGAASKALDLIHEIKRQTQKQSGQLASKRLPMFVSPMLMEVRELKRFNPLYLDFLDYGIVTFERKNTLADFLDAMRRIKHKREFRPYEVLRWQMAVQ